jgi:hypothetical protein
MSMKGAYNFVIGNMTAFEAIASLGLGLVAGVRLPAMTEKLISKISGRSLDLTSGFRGPIAGGVLTGLAAYALSSMRLVSNNVANTIALAGATVAVLNLANTYLNLPLPGVALVNPSGSSGFGGLLAGSNTMPGNDSAFGYLGEAPFEPFGMSHGMHDGAAGYHDMGRVINVF